MNIHERYVASIAIFITIAACFTISSEAVSGESKEVKELTLTEIQAGSPCKNPRGRS